VGGGGLGERNERPTIGLARRRSTRTSTLLEPDPPPAPSLREPAGLLVQGSGALPLLPQETPGCAWRARHRRGSRGRPAPSGRPHRPPSTQAPLPLRPKAPGEALQRGLPRRRAGHAGGPRAKGRRSGRDRGHPDPREPARLPITMKFATAVMRSKRLPPRQRPPILPRCRATMSQSRLRADAPSGGAFEPSARSSKSPMGRPRPKKSRTSSARRISSSNFRSGTLSANARSGRHHGALSGRTAARSA